MKPTLFLLSIFDLTICPSTAANLTPDPAISGWRNAAGGSTLSFEALPLTGGVTGFKASGQATFKGKAIRLFECAVESYGSTIEKGRPAAYPISILQKTEFTNVLWDSMSMGK